MEFPALTNAESILGVLADHVAGDMTRNCSMLVAQIILAVTNRSELTNANSFDARAAMLRRA